LGLILGTLIEQNFRRALIISDGSWMVFLQSPLSIILLSLTAVSLIYPIFKALWKKKQADPA
ncbi:MAG: tripartite tricarboxylate transporter permease, partial [Desulfocucumaceae bacterium]